MLCTVFLCSCATYPIEKSAHPIAIGVDYDSAVALAEAARDAVEGAGHHGMRSCYLSNMRTGATGDAYYVTLTLTIKIA